MYARDLWPSDVLLGLIVGSMVTASVLAALGRSDVAAATRRPGSDSVEVQLAARSGREHSDAGRTDATPRADETRSAPAPHRSRWSPPAEPRRARRVAKPEPDAPERDAPEPQADGGDPQTEAGNAIDRSAIAEYRATLQRWLTAELASALGAGELAGRRIDAIVELDDARRIVAVGVEDLDERSLLGSARSVLSTLVGAELPEPPTSYPGPLQRRIRVSLVVPQESAT